MDLLLAGLLLVFIVAVGLVAALGIAARLDRWRRRRRSPR